MLARISMKLIIMYVFQRSAQNYSTKPTWKFFSIADRSFVGLTNSLAHYSDLVGRNGFYNQKKKKKMKEKKEKRYLLEYCKTKQKTNKQTKNEDTIFIHL